MAEDREMEDRRKDSKGQTYVTVPAPATLQLEVLDDSISPHDYNKNPDDPRLAGSGLICPSSYRRNDPLRRFLFRSVIEG